MGKTWLSPQIRGALLQRLLPESQWLVGWGHFRDPPFSPPPLWGPWPPPRSGFQSSPLSWPYADTFLHLEVCSALHRPGCLPLECREAGQLPPARTEPGVLDSVRASCLLRLLCLCSLPPPPPGSPAPGGGLPALSWRPALLLGAATWPLLSRSSPAAQQSWSNCPRGLRAQTHQVTPALAGHTPTPASIPPPPPAPSWWGSWVSISWGLPDRANFGLVPSRPLRGLCSPACSDPRPRAGPPPPPAAWLRARAQHRARHAVSAWGVGGGQVWGGGASGQNGG